MHARAAATLMTLMPLPQVAAAQTGPVAVFPTDRAALFRLDAAGTRSEEGYAPIGLTLGPFRAFPALRIDAAANSNVFNSSDAQGDVLLAARPSLGLVTDWSRHAVTLAADARLTRFARLERENSEEFAVDADGRYDIDPTAQAYARLGFARVVESRSESGLDIPRSEPIVFDEARAALGGRKEFGNVRVEVAASALERRFDDVRLAQGPLLGLGFRDIRTIAVAPRIDYALVPGGAATVFARGNYSWSKSLAAPACCVRDSQGGVALAGVRVQLGRLWAGEVAAGWRDRRFTSPQFADYQGFTYQATIDWYPTELLSVRLTTQQDFENSGLQAVAGILTRTTRLSAYYDPLPNARVTASFDLVDQNFREIDVETRLISAGLAGSYALSRNLAAGFQLRGRERSTSDADRLGSYRGVSFALWLGYSI